MDSEGPRPFKAESLTTSSSMDRDSKVTHEDNGSARTMALMLAYSA